MQYLGDFHDRMGDDTHDILAVSAWSGTTLVMCQLHETLFTSTANSGGVAGAFLESDRSQKDGRNWR